MRKTPTAVLIASLAALAANSSALAQSHAHHAAAAPAQNHAAHANHNQHSVKLINGTGAEIGSVELKQGPSGLLMVVEASGLTPGWHGIHLHATGQCEAPFTSAGAHINHADTKLPHGLLNAEGPDYGDLPNIFAGADGTAKAELFTTRARISAEGQGEWLLDADGSAIVIHANADDHTSQPIGGAGDRVACGAITSH